MNRNRVAEKVHKATQHKVNQHKRRREALARAERARKKARKGPNAMAEFMRKEGYEPNSQDGWRRINKNRREQPQAISKGEV